MIWMITLSPDWVEMVGTHTGEYEGDLNEEGDPHGTGTWSCDEVVLHGTWQKGEPVAVTVAVGHQTWSYAEGVFQRKQQDLLIRAERIHKSWGTQVKWTLTYPFVTLTSHDPVILRFTQVVKDWRHLLWVHETEETLFTGYYQTFFRTTPHREGLGLVWHKREPRLRIGQWHENQENGYTWDVLPDGTVFQHVWLGTRFFTALMIGDEVPLPPQAERLGVRSFYTFWEQVKTIYPQVDDTFRYVCLIWWDVCVVDKSSRPVPSAPPLSPPLSPSPPQEEEEGDQTTCVICLDQPKTVAFAPCGHYCVCGTCGQALPTCPMCREPVDHVLRIFS